LPLLSEAGTDRRDALRFAKEFESIGAKQLAPIKGVNRNIKLNLVSDVVMRSNDKKFNPKDPNWPFKCEESSDDSFPKRVLSLLQISETREIFGLTYRDLIDMDEDTFGYISDKIVNLANERIKREKEEESKAKNEQRPH